MTKELLENLKQDIDLIIKDNFHPRNLDLMNICIREEVPELIKFVEKVNFILSLELKDPTGNYQHGYKDMLDQIRREVL